MNAKNDGDNSKVSRLIDSYELRGIGDDLEHRWTRKDDRDSLRDLAEYFNKQLLKAVIDRSEVEPLSVEVDNLYRIFTGDDVSQGVRQETLTHLEQHGIDVESLKGDLVTYQAIRTYLQNVRNVDSPTDTHDGPSHRSAKQSTIQQLSSRLNTVTTAALTELKNAGHLTLGDFEVIVSVNVHCADCQSRLSISNILREGGCHCEVS
jgi:hypothetical protein